MFFSVKSNRKLFFLLFSFFSKISVIQTHLGMHCVLHSIAVFPAPVVHAGLQLDAAMHAELHSLATPPDTECLFHACILVAAEDVHLT